MLQNNEKIPDIFRSEAFKEFIRDHVHNNVQALLLKAANSGDARLRLFAAQAGIYHKAIHKLPLFVNNFCVFTPLAYEQSSSEITARHKTSGYLGERCLDICGGLGVDDWAFAQKFGEVVSLDTNAELNRIVRYNFELLGVKNVQRMETEAKVFLSQNNQTFDLVYADADRRVSGKKMAGFEGSEPFIPALLPLLFAAGERVLLKVSPMADITACLRQLQCVKEVEVVSVQNEVKELLFHLQRDYNGHIIYTATDIGKELKLVQFTTADKAVERRIDYNGAYFYEPALALIKSGLAETYASHFDELFFAGRQSLYMLSNVLKTDFFGRSFQLITVMPYQLKTLAKYLSQQGITYGNIAKRDFPESTDLIRKKLKLKDGGEDYFFFTKAGTEGKLMCFHCRRI